MDESGDKRSASDYLLPSPSRLYPTTGSCLLHKGTVVGDFLPDDLRNGFWSDAGESILKPVHLVWELSVVVADRE